LATFIEKQVPDPFVRGGSISPRNREFQAAWEAFKTFQGVDERWGIADRDCDSDGSHRSDDQLHDPLPNCDPRPQMTLGDDQACDGHHKINDSASPNAGEPRDSDSGWCRPILPVMRLYLVAYQSHEAEFLGAAIVEAFDQSKARERAEAAGIHQPGAMSVVNQVDAVPPDLIGRKLSPREVKKLVTSGPKKPPAPPVSR
jgi:hypothetical protein